MAQDNKEILENDEIRIGVIPDFGARIVDLIDKRTGRNWLVQGEPAGGTGDDAVYDGTTACGWDECFPTVLTCDASTTAWARTLRDHGDLWGRTWRTASHEASVTHTYECAEYRFSRTMSLDGPSVRLSYDVLNQSDEALPYLWSQHCLLSVGPEDRIELRSTSSMMTTALVSLGEALPLADFRWPDAPDRREPLTHVRPKEAGFALKAYAAVSDNFVARIGSNGCVLEFVWGGASVPFVGVWLDYGAWPADAPVHQIAIEPTTAPADDLAGAIRRGDHHLLAPKARASWTVEIAVARETLN